MTAELWDWADVAAVGECAKAWMRATNWTGDPGYSGPVASVLAILDRTPRVGMGPSVWAWIQGAAAGIRYGWEQAWVEK